MEYTRTYLQSLIDNRIEESGELEYKAAKSLARDEGKTVEISKDISAFANAAGGVLIYGIAEYNDKNLRHLPERLDPVNQTEFSREWLDQKIGLIRPKIEGLKIIPIHVGPDISSYCYAVEIPQSGTAHQARDFRYYRRRNFEVLPMEDYEVRDVMNRRKHPAVTAQVRLRMGYGQVNEFSVLFHNVSKVMAHHFAALVRLPLRSSRGMMFKPENAAFVSEGEESSWRLTLRNQQGEPLFPDGYAVLSRKIDAPYETHSDPGPSISSIRLILYADEMERIEIEKDLAAAERDWS